MRYCTLDPEPSGERDAANAAAPTLRLQGRWVLANLESIDRDLARALAGSRRRRVRRSAAGPELAALQVDGAGLEALDTAAANRLVRALAAPPGALPRIAGFDPRHRRLLELVAARPGVPPAPADRHHWIWRLGRAGYALELAALGVLSFLGRLATELARTLVPPGLRWRETLIQCRHAGLEAIPVVVLITCLIGVVVAYLLGLQATKYGANVFVIDGVAIGMVREFSPLLVATIVAGRSGAAYTAQLGTMKLAQEIDAIRMTGLSAEQVLVVPRVLALAATLPLLVFLGDVAGLAGAAAICHWMLDLTPATFIDRVQSELGPTHFLVGLAKAPVFAFAIALIGCHKGMAVQRDTRAIGAATTATVVHAIVAVIVLDAFFAVVLQALGI